MVHGSLSFGAEDTAFSGDMRSARDTRMSKGRIRSSLKGLTRASRGEFLPVYLSTTRMLEPISINLPSGCALEMSSSTTIGSRWNSSITTVLSWPRRSVTTRVKASRSPM